MNKYKIFLLYQKAIKIFKYLYSCYVVGKGNNWGRIKILSMKTFLKLNMIYGKYDQF